MADNSRPGRGNPRRRIAGQRRTPDRRPDGPGDEQAAEETATEQTTTDEAVTVDADEAVPVEADDGDGDAAVAEGDEAEPAGRALRMLTAAIGVVVVLTLTVAVVLGQRAWQGRQAERARSEASTAARKAAELILSYDHKTLDDNFAAARATLAPEYAADFDQTAKVVGVQAKKVKATVRAEVREVGVRDGDADRVTLLVFVNQTTTSTITQNKPRVDLNRARFTMVRIGDQWLVRSIDGL